MYLTVSVIFIFRMFFTLFVYFIPFTDGENDI